MHFYHLPFPIRDYVNDCKLILDSSSRVIMGMIEIAKDKGYFDSFSNAVYIQQAIYQGFGCNLPFITYPNWQKMDNKFGGLAGLVETIAEDPNKVINFLKEKVQEYDEKKK